MSDLGTVLTDGIKVSLELGGPHLFVNKGEGVSRPVEQPYALRWALHALTSHSNHSAGEYSARESIGPFPHGFDGMK